MRCCVNFVMVNMDSVFGFYINYGMDFVWNEIDMGEHSVRIEDFF